MSKCFEQKRSADTGIDHSLSDLRRAAALVESAAFDLAEQVPSNVIADLMMAAAQIERLADEIGPKKSRSH